MATEIRCDQRREFESFGTIRCGRAKYHDGPHDYAALLTRRHRRSEIRTLLIIAASAVSGSVASLWIFYMAFIATFLVGFGPYDPGLSDEIAFALFFISGFILAASLVVLVVSHSRHSRRVAALRPLASSTSVRS